VKAAKDAEGLAGLTTRISERGIAIRAFATIPKFGQFALSKLMNCQINEVAKSAYGKLAIPQDLIEACSLAWLNMVSVELALVESGSGRIAPLLKCVYATSPIVRGDAALLAGVFGDGKVQQAFWGSEAASLLDFWQRATSGALELLVLRKDEFEELVNGEAIHPILAARYGSTPCICVETLRLHIPYFPSDDRVPLPSGGAATCLPLTHRGIAASNGFCLLSMQLTGWH
jgi:hypothetical protein